MRALLNTMFLPLLVKENPSSKEKYKLCLAAETTSRVNSITYTGG